MSAYGACQMTASHGGSASAIPGSPTRSPGVVAGSDLAVATSGTYERGLHVLDPFTGLPASFLRSVTVTGPDLAIADAYATAAVAMNDRGLSWLAHDGRIRMRGRDGARRRLSVRRSPGGADRPRRRTAVIVTRATRPS